MTKKEKREAKEDAIKFLREQIKPGATVYTVLTNVSRSGMSRRIRCLVLDPEGGDPWDISGYVARALEYRRNDRDGGVVVGGCGMDMGFHIVHSLSYALHGMTSVNVPPEKEGRPHTPTPESYRAGYSLKHRWL